MPFSPTTHRIRRRLGREADYWLELLRERIELREERRLLAEVRTGRTVCWEDEAEPLVTVRIATFDRGPLLAERALASAVRQTYSRLEILVIGDACTAETTKAVRSVKDRRIRFVNLPTRGLYPVYRAHRRKVAGTHPMNAGLMLARGAWLAPLDDDDEFTDDHVEMLLAKARSGPFELAYSQALHERKPGEWSIVGDWPPRMGRVSHGSIFYSSALRFMRHSNTSWKLRNQPGDWNLLQRMKRAGVRMGFLPRVTYRHYLGAGERQRLAQAGSLPHAADRPDVESVGNAHPTNL